MTREEALMLSAYTGVLLVPDFEDVHRYCEELMGFPILTHEFAEERLQIEIREKLRPRVWALCQTAADNPSSGREQVEKAFPGCEMCREKKEVKSDNFCGAATMRIVGDSIDLRGNEKKIKFFGHIYAPSFSVKFCPFCGRPLTDEAVQMVMERMEALRGETETD